MSVLTKVQRSFFILCFNDPQQSAASLHYLPLNMKDDKKHSLFILKHQNQRTTQILSKISVYSKLEVRINQYYTDLTSVRNWHYWNAGAWLRYKPGGTPTCSKAVKIRSGWQHLPSFIHFDVSSSVVKNFNCQLWHAWRHLSTQRELAFWLVYLCCIIIYEGKNPCTSTP